MILVFIFGNNTYASENDFSLRLELSEHQVPNVKSYFSLNLNPGDTDELNIILTNKKDENQSFAINFTAATTNMNGIIDYTHQDAELVGNIVGDIRDIVSVSNSTITIPARSSRKVSLHAVMPVSHFDGMLLGGVTFSKLESVEEFTQEKSGVDSKFEYVIAVQISQGNIEIAPKLQKGVVTTNRVNGENLVSLEISNPDPSLLTKVSGKYAIFDKESGKLIAENTSDRMSIAPNSKFTPLINIGNYSKAGKYTFVAKLSNSQGSWELSEDFEITDEDAMKLTNPSIEQPTKDNSSSLIYIIIVGSIAMIVFMLLSLRIKK